MGAAENAEIVRRGYAAFNAGDMETLTELFDESASWHTPGRSPLAGDYVGRDAAFAQFHFELHDVAACVQRDAFAETGLIAIKVDG